jgi:hypothetical protein
VYQKRWVSEHCEQCSTDVCVDEFWDMTFSPFLKSPYWVQLNPAV